MLSRQVFWTALAGLLLIDNKKGRRELRWNFEPIFYWKRLNVAEVGKVAMYVE